MIQADRLTKKFGNTVAVDEVSFTVRPGRVTGFLGPNGAGKSTTMRMMLGLDRPTSGSVLVNGHTYADLAAPLRSVGALLDASAIDAGRTAANHLKWLVDSNALDRSRVPEVLDIVGMSDVANKRVGEFSLGMKQRLGIAGTLLGDPETLIFDEPINGLDPDGILWIRNLMKSLAAEGRTVFLSSHLMSEMAQTAEYLVVIGRGRIIADASVDEIVAGHTTSTVVVRAAEQPKLAGLLVDNGGHITTNEDDALEVTGMDSGAIGRIAAAYGIALIELAPKGATLEEAFFDLTKNETVYSAAGAAGAADADLLVGATQGA